MTRRRLLIFLLTAALLASPILWIRFSPSTLCAGESLVDNDAWQRGTAMPTGRSELASAVLDRHIYVAGGLRTTGGSIAFERYDVDRDEWEQLAPLPVALHHLGLAALGGYVYVTGGALDLAMGDISAETYQYDPQTNTWATVAPMPSPRAAHISLSDDKNIYVIGGVGTGSTFVWVYDAQTDRWDAKPAALSAPREHLTGAVVNNQLVVIGGRWNQQNTATVEIYDLASQTWSNGEPMPTARGGLAAAAVDGQVHVFGGEAFAPCVFVQHEVYSVTSDAWKTAPAMPQARHGLTAEAMDNTIYVLGGASKATVQTLFTYTSRVDVYTVSE